MLLPIPSGFASAYKTPNLKPSGPIAVDRNHPLGRHVIRAFVPTSGAPADLVTGALKKSGGAAVKAGLGVFPGGANEFFEYGGPIPKLTEFTVIFRVRRNTLTDNHGVFSDSGFTDFSVKGFSINYQPTSGRILFIVNAAQTAANTTSTTTAFSDIACTWKAGAIQGIYQDGVEVSSYVAHGIAASHTVSTQPLRIGSYYSATTSNVFDGDISYVYMLDKALTGVQIKSIHLNPYQLIKPAADNVYYFPSAAGATYTLACDAGSYSLTGTDAGTIYNRVLAADSGSYSLTGTDAVLTFNRVMAANAGSYTYTGTDATLTYTTTGSTYTITADAGSYALTGTAAALLFNRVLVADPGTYSLTGTDATLARGWTLAADSGSYTVTGTDAAFVYSRVLTAETGAYTITGTNAVLTWSGGGVWTVQGDASTTWATQSNQSTTWTVQ